MKDILKIKFFLLVTMLFCGTVTAQENLTLAQKKPKQNEKVLVQSSITTNGYNSMQAAYNGALREAQSRFAGKSVDIRNLTKGEVKFTDEGMATNRYNYTIVELPDAVTLALSSALTKALAEVDEEGKFAINKVVITSEEVDKAKTSLVPMPNATAPIAPWVDVCESPQTIVIPGRLKPFSGPTTWIIPLSFDIMP